jgi:hypothetical protein
MLLKQMQNNIHEDRSSGEIPGFFFVMKRWMFEKRMIIKKCKRAVVTFPKKMPASTKSFQLGQPNW